MKVAAQILLIIFFVVLFFMGLISGTFKFQLLDYNFWQNTFQKHNVYQNLAIASKSSFESQISKEGGNKDDVSVLSDLITSENAKDVVDRNLQSFLSFTNGNSSQIIVYLPIDKVPKNLLPTSISGLKSEMTLGDLLAKFSFQDWQNLPLQNISHIGRDALFLFISSVLILILIIFSLILLIDKGKRLVSLGASFILSGSTILLFVNIGTNLNKVMSAGLTDKTQIIAVFSAVIFPSAVIEIMGIWKIVAFVVIILGFGLLFIKKWGYNKSK